MRIVPGGVQKSQDQINSNLSQIVDIDRLRQINQKNIGKLQDVAPMEYKPQESNGSMSWVNKGEKK